MWSADASLGVNMSLSILVHCYFALFLTLTYDLVSRMIVSGAYVL